MEHKQAMEKGFLNLTEKELDVVLGDLFNEDNPQVQLDHGLELLLSFIPEDKVDGVLDLAYIIHEAYYELGTFDDDDVDADEEFESLDDDDDDDDDDDVDDAVEEKPD